MNEGSRSINDEEKTAKNEWENGSGFLPALNIV